MTEHAPRYEPVPVEEEDIPAQTVNLAMVVDMPPPAAASLQNAAEDESPPPAYDGAFGGSIPPPSYAIATDLPSYAEAERTKKQMEEQMQHQQPTFHVQHIPDLHVDDDTSSISSSRLGGNQEVQLGTDCMFFLAFVTCFMFNWFGVVAVLCLVHTVAGRYGALSGFGLSMVKWAVIIKNNEWAKNYATGDSWLWWLFLSLGVLLFLRGLVQYIRIRTQWPELAATRRTKFYYFY